MTRSRVALSPRVTVCVESWNETYVPRSKSDPKGVKWSEAPESSIQSSCTPVYKKQGASDSQPESLSTTLRDWLFCFFFPLSGGPDEVCWEEEDPGVL